MRKKTYIALMSGIMLLIMVSSARAENWLHTATADDNKVKAYVDVDSITKDGDKRRFWMYHDFKGVESFHENPIEKAFGYDVVDCKDKTIQYMEVIIERSDGSRMKSKLIKPEVEKVRPKSVNEGILEFVCDYKT